VIDWEGGVRRLKRRVPLLGRGCKWEVCGVEFRGWWQDLVRAGITNCEIVSPMKILASFLGCFKLSEDEDGMLQ